MSRAHRARAAAPDRADVVGTLPLALPLGRPGGAPRRGGWRRPWRDRPAAIALIVVCLLAVVAVAAPILAPYDPRVAHPAAYDASPSAAHPFGGDALGRDILSRVIFGARVSLAVGVISQLVALAVGLPLGLLAGVRGGTIDALVMRLTDMMFAFPVLVLVILFNAALRASPIQTFESGLLVVLFAVSLASWPIYARLVRVQALALRERDFVMAARMIGATPGGITVRHLLPNMLGPMLVALASGVPQAIFAEATLSYLGLGIAPPQPSWGSMVYEGYGALGVRPHQALFPSLAIVLATLAFTVLGDALRDALDPRGRR